MSDPTPDSPPKSPTVESTKKTDPHRRVKTNPDLLGRLADVHDPVMAHQALREIRQIHQASLDANAQSRLAVHDTVREAMAMLREQLDSPDLSDQARESINARLIELVELDASKDTEDKEHRRDLHLNSNKAFLMGVAVVVTAGVAVVNPDAAKALFRTAVKNGPQAAKALT